VPSYFLCLKYHELNLRPFKPDFIFGKSQNSFEAKSGEHGGYSIKVKKRKGKVILALFN